MPSGTMVGGISGYLMGPIALWHYARHCSASGVEAGDETAAVVVVGTTIRLFAATADHELR